MTVRVHSTLAGLAGTAVLAAVQTAGAEVGLPPGAVPVGIPVNWTIINGPCGGDAAPAEGADLVVCRIGGADGSDLKEYSPVAGIGAYAFGTTSCNNGTTLLDWLDDPPLANRHPVIAQNVFRLSGGRFEQIGMSWLKHGFCAADNGLCGACAPVNNCFALGIGCADTYQAQINGDFPQFLGPRSEVNPHTGWFPFPHSVPSGANAGRVQINHDDLDPALNDGARYFGESQYITPDDAGTANAHNNNTYREIIVEPKFFGTYPLTFTGGNVQQEPAINAWQAADPAVDLVTIDVPGDGRFILGYNVTEDPPGTWNYEYALYNMNAHRAARLFSVPAAATAVLSDPGFHDVHYHSGESYDGSDWSWSPAGSAGTWSTAVESENPNANALRWGTLYNFRFTADRPPAMVEATIGLFRAGAPSALTVSVLGPAGAPAQDPCPWDCDGDGIVGIGDFLMVLGGWGPGTACDGDGDGMTGISDFLGVLGNWGPCP